MWLRDRSGERSSDDRIHCIATIGQDSCPDTLDDRLADDITALNLRAKISSYP